MNVYKQKSLLLATKLLLHMRINRCRHSDLKKQIEEKENENRRLYNQRKFIYLFHNFKTFPFEIYIT